MTALLLLVGISAGVRAPPAQTPMHLRCGTPALMRDGPPAHARRDAAVAVTKANGKAERDAAADIPNVVVSENFALKWGSGASLSPALAAEILAVFEVAWQAEIVRMGHPLPAGCEQYLLNVYIGDTGDEVPSAGNSTGYYYVDADGWPLIVIAADLIDDLDYLAGVVAAHELFHAVAARADHLPYSDTTAWFHEASAEWITGEVFPGNPHFGAMLFGYAFAPHLRLDAFDYPDTGALVEYHAYGTFIFLRYLSEHLVGWRFVRDLWLMPASIADPLALIVARLAAEGFDAADAFADFAARNATWDYADHDLFTAHLQRAEEQLPGHNLQLAAAVDPGGTQGWRWPPSATLPERFGVNTIALPPGTLEVSVAAEPTGSHHTPFALRAVVVRELGGGGIEYLPLSVHAGIVKLMVGSRPPSTRSYLVVSVTADDAVADETFAYRYAVVTEPGGDPTAAGGCNDLGNVGPDWLLLGLVAARLLRARCRRRASASA